MSAQQNALLEFNTSYRETDWNKILSNANQSIDIVVYYWDKWIKEHENSLFQFLSKPNSKLNFFFSNNYPEIQRLFPGNTQEQLKSKIENTYKPLQHYLKKHHLPEGKVNVHYVPTPLNYSMQCIDNKILVLSFFEMFRQNQVDSPAILIDLDKSPPLKAFYQKELQGFLNGSQKNKNS